MSTEQLVRAPSGVEVGWHSIDWPKAYEYVRGMQTRIVEAWGAGKHGKVKSLQHLLTHSFYGRAIAVKRVTENRGKQTPGVDGEIWNTPEDKINAVLSLNRPGYQPKPLKRVYIPKSNGKKRPLSIPTMFDRAMQALYCLALLPIAETTADKHSYGFRPERCPADAIGQCFIILSGSDRPKYILEGDIKGCFDNISHDWLMANIPMDKAILRKFLKAGFIENSTRFPTDMGTPQGGLISATLANMTLDGLERMLNEAFPKTTVAGRAAMVNVVRYADDFIVTGSSKELLETRVKPLVEAFMQTRGLELSQEKTRITHIDDGFDFLSQNVRKYDGKMLIKPAKKAISELLAKVREIVKANKASEQARLIEQLNPIIRGWANYHRHIVAARTFEVIDSAIWELIWQWAKRRHPNKGAKWIRQRYFRTIGNRQWVFAVDKIDAKGNTRTFWLAKASDTPIKRHVIIKAEVNPFDPAHTDYIEKRRRNKMLSKLGGQQRRLYMVQNGVCPVCRQPIDDDVEWDNHHKVRKADGGADTDENRVLVHLNCHREVHSHWAKVTKPAPDWGL
jgi:RNA-directed DNA polymerase